MKKTLLLLLFIVISPVHATLPLQQLSLPPGFHISLYAEGVENARQMALGKTGIVYVGSRRAGKVHAVVDDNKDGVADRVVLIAKGLNMPSGLTYKNGDLYVAEVQRVVKFPHIDQTYANKPKAVTVIDDLPSETWHGWKYIDFGPDGWLYVPVGVPCNVCETNGGEKFDDPIYASIVKYNLKTGEKRWVAKGVRNSVGFDWQPQSGDFWFSDNGRDMMGDDIPPCEINRVTKEGEHFGFPYFHGGNIADPEFGKGKKASDYSSPALNLGAHVAPLGIHFYSGNAFPAEYKSDLFVAEHGSWNRSPEAGHVGYRVMIANVRGEKISGYKPFIEGWLDKGKNQGWGRPVALLTLPDGSLLISDDFANVIYRVTYRKDKKDNEVL